MARFTARPPTFRYQLDRKLSENQNWSGRCAGKGNLFLTEIILSFAVIATDFAVIEPICDQCALISRS